MPTCLQREDEYLSSTCLRICPQSSDRDNISHIPFISFNHCSFSAQSSSLCPDNRYCTRHCLLFEISRSGHSIRLYICKGKPCDHNSIYLLALVLLSRFFHSTLNNSKFFCDSLLAVMAAMLAMPLVLEQATTACTQSPKTNSHQLSTFVAARRKIRSIAPVTFPKFGDLETLVDESSILQQRGGDKEGVTIARDEFNVDDTLHEGAYYSELTEVNLTRQTSEPEASEELMDLLSLPKDDNLSRGPTATYERKKPARCKPTGPRKVRSSVEELLLNGKQAHELPSHPVVQEEAKKTFHDPNKQEPWKPLLVFDNRLIKAHGDHLRRWEAEAADLDLNEARYEPYEVHNEPCQHPKCGCDKASDCKSDEMSKALGRVKHSREWQKDFYQRLETAHTTITSKDSQTSANTRCVDMHGICRAFDAPDGPIGIFSQAEVDLCTDNLRLKLRNLRMKKGKSAASLDAVELKVLGKTQEQLRSDRLKVEDALFAQHRLFPQGRKHATLKLYVRPKISTSAASEKSTAGPTVRIPKTSHVADDAGQSPMKAITTTTTRSGRASKPRKIYGDDIEMERRRSGSGDEASCKGPSPSAANPVCAGATAAAIKSPNARSGIILKLKRSRSDFEKGEDADAVEGPRVPHSPKRCRLVLKVSSRKRE
nr:hypothetical protein CFP56_60758 [Quercus suber]